MIHIGLTGGIASGKSTVAAMFGQLGCAVFNADDYVHWLYTQRDVLDWFQQRVPDAVHGGHIDRAILAAAIKARPTLLADIEAMVHPLVRYYEIQFSHHNFRNGTDIIISDNPLLCETASMARYDTVLVVTAPLWLRRARALRRGGMNAARFDERVAQQMPDTQKLRYADMHIHNGLGKAHAMRHVKSHYTQLIHRSLPAYV